MNSLAARVAPEVDRLVLGVNRAVGPRHGHVLMAVARELGLDSLKLIPHFVDFWLDGPLPAYVAVARLPYAPEGAVLPRIERFVSTGLLSDTPSGFEPTARFRPLLAASLAAREEVVFATWTGFDQTIADLGSLVDRVIQAVPNSHTVAVAHRALTSAPDSFLRMYDRLVTMRFIRQHDHVEAWRARGMTGAGMTALTALWYGDSVPDDAPGLMQLEENGLVRSGLITEAGRRLREEIEADTNLRGERTLSVLDQSEGDHLLELLERLPGSSQR